MCLEQFHTQSILSAFSSQGALKYISVNSLLQVVCMSSMHNKLSSHLIPRPSYLICVHLLAMAGWNSGATRALVCVWGEQNIPRKLDGIAALVVNYCTCITGQLVPIQKTLVHGLKIYIYIYIYQTPHVI